MQNVASIPKTIELKKQKHFRIIPSVYPPINFFENMVDPAEMEILFEIEGMTNDRLRQEVGDIFLVPLQDRVSGPGSSVIMAAFTHIGRPSRFTNGSYGVYYAGLALETAIRETVYRREFFLRATLEDPGDITMRVYEGGIRKPLHDIRDRGEYENLHHPDSWHSSQIFGQKMRGDQSWGLVYHSVRHAGGICLAIFRPPAVSIPQQTMHLRYHWNGERIFAVSSAEIILEFEQGAGYCSTTSQG